MYAGRHFYSSFTVAKTHYMSSVSVQSCSKSGFYSISFLSRISPVTNLKCSFTLKTD